MKKLFLMVAVIGLAGFATSCKKECKCTMAGVDIPMQGVIDSKEACDAFQALQEVEEEGAPAVKCVWK